MSEYAWRVSKAWIGIDDGEKCIGVVVRSGDVRALGHFCHVKVSINGKHVWASGAEDRIYPFHSVSLSEIGGIPKHMIPAVGWATDHNTYCFRYKGRIVQLVKSAKVGIDNAVEDVPETIWQEAWRNGSS